MQEGERADVVHADALRDKGEAPDGGGQQQDKRIAKFQKDSSYGIFVLLQTMGMGLPGGRAGRKLPLGKWRLHHRVAHRYGLSDFCASRSIVSLIARVMNAAILSPWLSACA